MKVLVCGSSGLVGNDLCSLFEKENINYVGIHNKRPRKNSYKIDIRNTVKFSSFLDEQKPTVCVNCIADRNVDLCETDWEQTKEVNVGITEVLAKACAERNIYFLHISTDYVFDGRDPPYSPASEVNPLQNYGISKFLAECKAKKYKGSCIVRVPVLYTDSYTSLSETAVTVLAKKVLNQIETTKEDNYSVRRPVFIPDFCKFLLSCIEEKRCGLYHFYNDQDKTTKYEMCQKIAAHLRISSDHIQPVNTPPSNDAGRPYDTQFMDPQYNRNQFPSTNIDKGIAISLRRHWHPNSSDALFFLLDLDGTLVNTDKIHYDCYRKVLSESLYPMSWTFTWDYFRTCESVDKVLLGLVGCNEDKLAELKRKKREELKKLTSIDLIPGAKELLETFTERNINFAVVTNTNQETVNHFKSICPTLQLIKNWIVREDYKEAKPNPECFELAMKRFYRDEPYIVGVENNYYGAEALKSVTKCIYVVTDKDHPHFSLLKKEDYYLVPDLQALYTKVAK